MSEYQYYEFQAIDRPLGAADRQALRALSTRARITARSFVNSYEWGDFKGDPAKLMERWFDLHLYLADWGTRRLMIRLPGRLVDRDVLDGFLGEVDDVTILRSGKDVILDVVREELELEDDGDDESGLLAGLAPLRDDVLAGDMRLFYLIWLMRVERGAAEPDEREPLPGIGPLSGSLEAFADFFRLDPDLVAAAAERPAAAGPASPSAARRVIAAMADGAKTELLARLFGGEPHVAAELRALVRRRLAEGSVAPPPKARTVRDLRARAQAIGAARARAEAERRAAESRRQAEAAERTRRARLVAIARRGEAVWTEIETEIARRNGPGYDRAAGLLFDLRAIADEGGTMPDFGRRLRAIRERHAQKARFIERLAALG